MHLHPLLYRAALLCLAAFYRGYSTVSTNCEKPGSFAEGFVGPEVSDAVI